MNAITKRFKSLLVEDLLEGRGGTVKNLMEYLDPRVLEKMFGIKGCDQERIREISQHAIHYDGELPVNSTSPDGRYVIVACLYILDTLLGKVYKTRASFGLVLDGDQYIKDVRWDGGNLYYDVVTIYQYIVDSYRFDLAQAKHYELGSRIVD